MNDYAQSSQQNNASSPSGHGGEEPHEAWLRHVHRLRDAEIEAREAQIAAAAVRAEAINYLASLAEESIEVCEFIDDEVQRRLRGPPGLDLPPQPCSPTPYPSAAYPPEEVHSPPQSCSPALHHSGPRPPVTSLVAGVEAVDIIGVQHGGSSGSSSSTSAFSHQTREQQQRLAMLDADVQCMPRAELSQVPSTSELNGRISSAEAATLRKLMLSNEKQRAAATAAADEKRAALAEDAEIQAMPAAPMISGDHLTAFCQKNGVEASVEQVFRSAPPEMQARVMNEGPLVGDMPTEVLIARVRRFMGQAAPAADAEIIQAEQQEASTVLVAAPTPPDAEKKTASGLSKFRLILWRILLNDDDDD